MSNRAVAVLLLAGMLGGCWSRHGREPGPDAGAPVHNLARVGAGELTAHPGDYLTLRAVLVDPAGATGPNGEPLPVRLRGDVHWTIEDGDGTLGSVDTTTNEDGLTENSFVVPNFIGTIRIRADVDGATSKAIWRITVTPVVKRMRIIPNPPLVNTTNPAQTKADVIGPVGASVDLQVQVLALVESLDIDVPFPGEAMTFQFVTSIAGANFEGVRTTETGLNGTTSVTLQLGYTVGTYKVIATIPGNISVEFNIQVTNQQPACVISSDCSPSDICRNGTCVGRAPSEQYCQSDLACPLGYQCDLDRTCVPLPAHCDPSYCPSGFSCGAGLSTCVPDNPECSATVACASGSECQSGSCYPEDGTVANVIGHWYTRHTFEIGGSLPSWTSMGSSASQHLDELLHGTPSSTAAANALLADLAQYYRPVWAEPLGGFLKNTQNTFARVEIYGEMDLAPVSGPLALYGTERWNRVVFHWLDQCGSNVGQIDPAHPPPCSDVIVYAADLAQANLPITAESFVAHLSGNQLTIDPRDVSLALDGVLAYTLQQVVGQASGYPSLRGPPGHPEQGALVNMMDCEGLATLVSDCGVTASVDTACSTWVNEAVTAIVDPFLLITATTDTLSLSGQVATVRSDVLSPYVTQLGPMDLNDASVSNGQWTADWATNTGNVAGGWRASRTPIP